MYTQCPSCHTYFRISAQHLKIAEGQVRCGQCHAVFNALEHLCENPTQPSRQPATTPAGGSTLADAETDDLEAFFNNTPATSDAEPETAPPEPPQPAPELKPRQTPAISIAQAPRTEAVAPPLARQDAPVARVTPVPDPVISAEAAAPEPFVPEEPVRHDFTTAAEQTPAGDGAVTETPAPPAPSTLPARLTLLDLDQTPLPAHPRSHPLWSIGSVLLLLAILAQYGYFERERLAENQDLRPWLERLCQVMKCTLPLQHDIARIDFLDRDIASHQAIADALVIRATLVNSAPFRQPFPDLQVTFSNMVSQAVATRRFTPKEYLASGIDTRSGMMPDVPVRVQLQVIDPGTDAVNFEFDLLERRGSGDQ